jgi:starch-binding outer membrane protein, SusD/RagB family
VKLQEDNLTATVETLDRIRTSHGLQPLAIAKPSVLTSTNELIGELLNQRRYSLWYEGHRRVDMRRYNKLAELPLDLAGDKVYPQMVKPTDEQQN